MEPQTLESSAAASIAAAALPDNALTIGGHTARSLVEKFGSPLYVYDAEVIRQHFQRLTSAFSGVPHRLLYACKANNNMAIIKFIHQLGAGVDAVSASEVELAFRCGVPANQILFTPNCVAFSEIEYAAERGVLVNIDNISVLERFGQNYGGSKPCAIRINPHILAGGNAHIQTGHIDSKFGISIHQMRHILRVINAYGMNVVGLHMHTGSEILDPQTFVTGAEILFDAAFQFPNLQFLDFGSGFKVPYKTDDIATDVESLGETMTARFREFCNEYGRQLELWFEPGKFLVSASGYLLVTATVLKQTPSCVFIGTDSGLNHLIRPMLYDAYHGIINADQLQGTERIYTVVGCICETDTFGVDRRLVQAQEGTILALKNAGAYGYAMSSNYNLRARPAEVLILNGRPHCIRRRETLEDMLRLQMEPELQEEQ
ncbi:MAG: diaminopimelate decarboxylase [Chlorobi bacterium]|nr:MAG: diaminopimelate decarboxylase [Chlorobi bacterium OLB7]MBK8912066.1 diaminopimelate decarboxylase [Chlorobiota bacterium]MBX7217159.1 diaminopimelate decarboxylase [Candidatus Kapabacteria bacterium]